MTDPAESKDLRELLYGDANILPRLLAGADDAPLILEAVKRIEGMLGGWQPLTPFAPVTPEGEPLVWDGHPTPKEAAELLRAYARRKQLMPGDNNFEDAAEIIDRLAALVSGKVPHV